MTPADKEQESRDLFEPDRGLVGFGKYVEISSGEPRFCGAMLADIADELAEEG